MEIRLPLSHFLNYLKSTKEQGRKFPRLNEAEWLLRNFRFDDQTAEYEPEPSHARQFRSENGDKNFARWDRTS
jgi:hypothetical protein